MSKLSDIYLKNLLKLLSSNIDLFDSFDDDLKNNRDFLLVLLKIDGRIFHKLSESLKHDIALVRVAVVADRCPLVYIPNEHMDDYELVLSAVVRNGSVLQHLNSHLRDNEEIVRIAIQNQGSCIRYASPRLQQSYELSELAVSRSGRALDSLIIEYQYCKELILKAVSDTNRETLDCVPQGCRSDMDILITALYSHVRNQHYIPEQLRYHEIVEFMISHRKDILVSDWPIVKQALLQNASVFLHPDTLIMELASGSPHKYSLLAKYALSQLNNDPDIDMCLANDVMLMN